MLCLQSSHIFNICTKHHAPSDQLDQRTYVRCQKLTILSFLYYPISVSHSKFLIQCLLHYIYKIVALHFMLCVYEVSCLCRLPAMAYVCSQRRMLNICTYNILYMKFARSNLSSMKKKILQMKISRSLSPSIVFVL